ncbi:MAG: PspC domain-containing protein [Bacteroidota bacterium]
MNKTININLGGVFFHIDEIAYHKLKNYLDAIRRSLSDDPKGLDEIITDIESRIGELLSDKVKDVRQVVNENDINEVIDVMGKPEDYIVDEDVFTDDDSFYQKKRPKKLYRDGDDKFLGGVSSGMAHYLNVDVIWIRLAWLVAAFGFGFGFIAYIILWILLPEANTTAEKLEMMGEQVNISNIEKKIKDELSGASDRIKSGIDDVSEKVKSADYQKYTDKAKSGTQDLVSTLGKIFEAIFMIIGKFFGVLLVFISVVTIIALIISLFAVGSIDFIHEGWFNQNGAVFNNTGLPIWIVTLLTLILVGIPFFFLFMLGLRILSSSASRLGKTTRLSLFGIWLVVLLVAIFFGTKQIVYTAHDGYFNESKNITTLVPDTLHIKMVDNEKLSNYDNLRRRRSDYSLVYDENDKKKIYSNNVRLNILSTDGDQVFAKIRKRANGKSKEDARESASFIEYDFDLADNDIILDGYFLTDADNKFRKQGVYVDLYLPEDQVIYIDKSAKTFLYDVSNIQNLYDSDMVKHHYEMTEEGLNCIDCKSFEIESSDNNGAESFDMKINKEGVHIKIQDEGNEKAEVKIDETGITVESSKDSI